DTTATDAPATPPEVPADIQAHIDEHADLIRLESPEPLAVIESPLQVTGRARGGWYFEASFPLVLVNWDGLIIAEGYATAEGEWMTGEFVPFSGSIEFETPDYGERGALILQRHNASGLPEHDDALEVPIRFDVD
ncbi:MAG TPA: Gmad2 immunoglobulin-like domain-containing protein, partial [Longimicrobiaceae bacterium]|nr:Gmad2 immunoglobulin-like domain-containing protein [Longimicrobiaceae bacterium]